MTKYKKNVLDKLWQETLRKVRPNACEVCGKRGQLNGHHIFTRSRFNTRWDIDNGILLCVGCHTMSSQLSAHGAPREFFAWLEKVRGKAWVDMLEVRSQMVSGYLDYELIKLSLENETPK